MAFPSIIAACGEYQYAVKVVCGKQKKDKGIVAPGRYFTAINIHNPTQNRVQFKRKLAIAYPGAKPGPVSDWEIAEIGPGQAVEIDCPDIFELAGKDKKFIKGFLTIACLSELDVVAVYTTSEISCRQVNAFHTERVPARVCQRTCEDLDMSFYTGHSDWRVVEAPDPHDPNLPSLMVDAEVEVQNYPPPPWAAVSGADWVSFGPPLEGQYRYRYCFNLCRDFKDARLELSLRSDNLGEVYLNGSKIGTVPANSWSASQNETQISVQNQALFRSGENALEVMVQNTAGPTGFACAGKLTGKHAQCPEKYHED